MIFVTIGTQAPFDRFIKIIDEIAPLLNELIVAQIYKGEYKPRNIKSIDFLPPDEFNKLFDEARLVVSHAGMGSIISALQKRKPIIVFPRIAALGEHRNEHQMATAKKMKKLGFVYVALDEKELKKMLFSKDLHCLHELGESASSSLIQSITDYISF